MPVAPTFEFDPFPRRLYTAEALLDGFDPSKPASYAKMLDVRIYREFVRGGGAATGDYFTAMSRALHDNGITQHLADLIGPGNAGTMVVAIMGGHGVARNDPAFLSAAKLAAVLAAKGFLVASGGGPGVMEAAHLGASFANDDAGLDDALARLGQGPLKIPPNAGELVGVGGVLNEAIAEALGNYLAPAVQIVRSGPRGGGLGVPTWLYGHEPFTPFAQHVAKYFQNSIREDGLLGLATHGIVYTPGGAGTLQEVFQDAAQNFYHLYPAGPATSGYFSPMVFFGNPWKEELPVKPLLDAIFDPPSPAGSRSGPPDEVRHEYRRLVRFTSDPKEVVDLLVQFKPPQPNKTLRRMALAQAALPGR